MPTAVFSQHHILLNYRPSPMRVENWRNGLDRDFIYQPNEIIVTPAGLESGWQWHSRSRVVVITIDPHKLERFAQHELGVLLTTGQLVDEPQCEDAELCAAGKMLLDALMTKNIGSEVMYESLARIFLVKLIEKYGDRIDSQLDFSRSFTAEHYKRVLSFVAERFGDPITVEDMATEAAMSPAHFSRLFKDVIGDPPYQFLMDYRVEQAKKMLVDQSRSLTDIGFACGFADQPHFTRVFRKLTGKTPRSYRASL